MGVNPWFLTAREGPRACSDRCSGWRRVGTQNSGGSIPRTLSLPADSQLLELRGRPTGQEARGSHGNTPRKQALGSSTRHLSGQLPPWGGGVGELGQVMHATPHSTPTETRCGRPLLPPRLSPLPSLQSLWPAPNSLLGERAGAPALAAQSLEAPSAAASWTLGGGGGEPRPLAPCAGAAPPQAETPPWATTVLPLLGQVNNCCCFGTRRSR